MNLAQKLCKHAYEIALIFLQIPLLYLSAFKFFSFTQGWNAIWVPDVIDGSAYREHFTPLPPLGILIEGLIPSLTKYPYHVEVIQNIFIWITLQIVIFKVISFHFSKPKALLGTTLSGYLMFSEPHDIISSYFELVLLFTFLTYLLIVNFERSCSIKRLIVVAALLVSIPLIKQSFLPLSLILLAFAYLKLTKVRPNVTSSFLKTVASIFLFCSFLLPAIFGIEIFSQLLGKSKSPSFSKILDSLIYTPNRILGTYLFLSILVTCILFYLHFLRAYTPENSRKQKQIEMCLAALFIVFFLLSLLRILTYLNIGAERIIAVSIVTILVIFAGVVRYLAGDSGRSARTSKTSALPISTAVGALLALVVFQVFSATNLTAMLVYGKVFIAQISVLVLLGISALIFGESVLKFLKTGNLKKGFIEILDYEFLIVISFSIVFVNSLSGGITIQSIPLFLPFVISGLVTFILKDLGPSKPKVQFLCISATSTLLVVICLMQTMNSPYVWWAIKLPPISQNIVTANNPPAITGFKIDTNTFQIVKTFQEVIDELALPGDEILVGPNITGAQLLVPQVDAMNLRCRISWWDVCPDSELVQDRNEILNNPPRFILWLYNPEFVTFGHESAFRSSVGQSELRKLNSDIVRFETSGKYVVAIDRLYGSDDTIEVNNSARIVLLVRK
jgi:hypothetical protein